MTKQQSHTRKTTIVKNQPICGKYNAGSLVYIKLNNGKEPVKIIKQLPNAKNTTIKMVLVQSLLTKHRYEIPCSNIL